MAATAISLPSPPRLRTPDGGAAPIETTLLELVRAVGEVTEDDREIVATVRHLLRSGRFVLCGSFRGELLDD